MSLSDPIGDMLARIKNAQLRNHKMIKFQIKKVVPLRNSRRHHFTAGDFDGFHCNEMNRMK